MKKQLFYFSLILFEVCFSNNSKSQGVTQLWGMAYGGSNNKGVIISTDVSGNNHTVEYNLSASEGKSPVYTHLTETPNGLLYGVTNEGGANNLGVLFEYNPATNNYYKKFDFSSTNGGNPKGSLLLASNGLLYGMTYLGGANSGGVMFEYNPATGVYTKKIDFSNVISGFRPIGNLIQASNGMIYGMTSQGGTYGNGVLFEYNLTTDTYTKKFTFNSSNGAFPNGSLMQASNGLLYGLTYSGGANNYGVIFEYNPTTNSYSKKYDFNSTDGKNPYGSLIQASNGLLYGMTYSGGANDLGVIFEYNPTTSVYALKIDLINAIGVRPNGSLMQASNGMLYGMTSQGGIYYKGTIFEYNSTTNTYTTKYNFNGVDGYSARGTLLQASNGLLYGLTLSGGSNAGGVLFEYDINTSTYSKKYDLNNSDGANPNGNIMQSSNGLLYGMTLQGGNSNKGVLFEYNLFIDNYAKRYSFSNVCFDPYGSLIQTSSGMLYGMTYYSLTNSGAIFRYNPSTYESFKIYDFNTTIGMNPYGNLIEASNGNLYGMTYSGGANNYGVIFQFNPISNIYTKKYDFNDTNGKNPRGSLLQASDGMLYGMTYSGGANNYGVIFQFNPTTSTFIKKYDFDSINGANPYGNLMEASNGVLYGMTYSGGVNNLGVIFQFNPSTDTYTKKYDFNSLDGANPQGNLLQASNSMLYGMTYSGGSNNKGVIFQFNPFTDTYTKKSDFNTTNGEYPRGDLVEICVSIPPQPGSISGNDTVCSGDTLDYSINIVEGAMDGYTWSVPLDWTIIAGQGDTNISVVIGTTNGNISVTAENLIGSSTPATKIITLRGIPSQPLVISGNETVCFSDTLNYSITSVDGASNYIWTVPSGFTILSGQGDTSITVEVGSISGDISVIAENLCGSSTPKSISITVLTTFPIMGYIEYPRSLGNASWSDVPMDSVWIYLEQNSVKVDSARSDLNGYYEFSPKQPGVYTISGASQKLSAGINTTDAAQAKAYFLSSYQINDNIRIKAGDVNSTSSTPFINTTDAAQIKGKYLLVYNNFIRGKFILENHSGNDTITIINDTANVDLWFVYVGDINCSAIPSQGAKGNSSIYQVLADIKQPIINNSIVEIPIIISNKTIETGAISLILNYPENLISITDVSLTSITSGSFDYNVIGDEIRIGWFGNNQKMEKGNQILTINAKIKAGINAGIIDIMIKPDQLNEFADEVGSIYENVEIGIPIINISKPTTTNDLSASGTYEISCSPNPVKEKANLIIKSQSGSSLRLVLYNTNGQIVRVFANNSKVDITTMYIIDGSMLPVGLYHLEAVWQNQRNVIKKSKNIIIAR